MGCDEDTVLVAVDPTLRLKPDATEFERDVQVTCAGFGALGRIHSERLGAKVDLREFCRVAYGTQYYAPGPAVFCAFGGNNIAH